MHTQEPLISCQIPLVTHTLDALKCLYVNPTLSAWTWRIVAHNSSPPLSQSSYPHSSLASITTSSRLFVPWSFRRILCVAPLHHRGMMGQVLSSETGGNFLRPRTDGDCLYDKKPRLGWNLSWQLWKLPFSNTPFKKGLHRFDVKHRLLHSQTLESRLESVGDRSIVYRGLWSRQTLPHLAILPHFNFGATSSRE